MKWSGITLSIFVLVRKYSPEFAVANVTHKSLCCDLLLGANRRFGATKALFPSKRKTVPLRVRFFFWSGLRGSNPPPPPWQGGALPNELNPHIWCLRSESNQRHGDFQSPALPTELQRRTGWRLGWGSNPRPLA